MRILWILPYSPWPATSGGKTRQFHLLRSLAARGHRITLLLHDKHPVSLAARQVLEAFVEQLIILPRRPLRSLKTLVAGLFAPYPLLASVNGLSGELRDTFNGLLGEQWDVVQIEHSYSFQPYEEALARKSQPFVLTEHNVESALGAATYDRLPRWSLPFIRYDQWRYTRWERRVMRQATHVVAVTDSDAKVNYEAMCRVAETVGRNSMIRQRHHLAYRRMKIAFISRIAIIDQLKPSKECRAATSSLTAIFSVKISYDGRLFHLSQLLFWI